jgi:sugar phosphate permease
MTTARCSKHRCNTAIAGFVRAHAPETVGDASGDNKNLETTIKKSIRLRRTQRVAIFLLTLAGCINYLDRSALSVANSMIRGEMGLSASEMGMLLSAFSMAYVLSQLPVACCLTASRR